MADASQLEEYEKQIAEIDELLQATPEDPSLLSLKNDLVELLQLTRSELVPAAAEPAATEAAAVPANNDSPAAAAASLPSAAAVPAEYLNEPTTAATTEAATTDNTTEERPKKKAKKIKEFEIPPRFLPLETDNEAQLDKKRRAIKQLKRQHRATVKEIESEKKQKSWQSFQKKKKLNKEGSIFSTTEGGDAKVGVVGGRTKTSFKERTRHK